MREEPCSADGSSPAAAPEAAMSGVLMKIGAGVRPTAWTAAPPVDCRIAPRRQKTDDLLAATAHEFAAAQDTPTGKPAQFAVGLPRDRVIPSPDFQGFPALDQDVSPALGMVDGLDYSGCAPVPEVRTAPQERGPAKVGRGSQQTCTTDRRDPEKGSAPAHREQEIRRVLLNHERAAREAAGGVCRTGTGSSPV